MVSIEHHWSSPAEQCPLSELAPASKSPFQMTSGSVCCAATGSPGTRKVSTRMIFCEFSMLGPEPSMKAASSSTGVLQGVRVPTWQWKAQVATCSDVGRARTFAHPSRAGATEIRSRFEGVLGQVLRLPRRREPSLGREQNVDVDGGGQGHVA